MQKMKKRKEKNSMGGGGGGAAAPSPLPCMLISAIKKTVYVMPLECSIWWTVNHMGKGWDYTAEYRARKGAYCTYNLLCFAEVHCFLWFSTLCSNTLKRKNLKHHYCWLCLKRHIMNGYITYEKGPEKTHCNIHKVCKEHMKRYM